MGLTQTAWTENSVNGKLVLDCTVTVAANYADSYTVKTPARTLDPTKPWMLYVNTAGTTLDTSPAVPVDIWAGYDSDFELTGDDGPTATSGAEIATAVIVDVTAETVAVLVDPNYTGTAVQSDTNIVGVVNAGTAPYYAINLDGTTHLSNAACHFLIVQDQ